MDKFTFNFGASEPEEEITPPPTQLAGVVFSFVPAPASELSQIEKDYQNYLQEWEHIKKLSAAQQIDLLRRSCLFIRNVKPGQFNIDKFADKLQYVYNNIADEIKDDFFKLFRQIVPRRFAGLELDLENKLASQDKNEFDYALLLLAMFFHSGGADTTTYLAKYLPKLKSIVEAYLSGSDVSKNNSVIYLCLRSVARACRFLAEGYQDIKKEAREMIEKVICAVAMLQNYPMDVAEQKLWWNLRRHLFKIMRFYVYGEQKNMSDPVVIAFTAMLDYLMEKNIEIPKDVKEAAANAFLELTSRSARGAKTAVKYWDLVILPHLRPASDAFANIDQTEQAANKIREDEHMFAYMTTLGILANLLARTERSRVITKIIETLNSTDLMTKCAGLNCLTELFPKAHYERDQLDQIITNTLIPGLDDTDLFIRALCCRSLSTLNSKAKQNLAPILPKLTAKLCDLLARDKFYVKYYAIKALNQFAVKLSGERLIESMILESHIREILAVNKLVPLPNVSALLKSDVFVNHAPAFLRDTLMRACDFMLKVDDEKSIEMASDYFTFAKDIFMSDRVVASQATLQAIEPVMVQFMGHPVLGRSEDLVAQAVLGDFLDVLGFATYHIPLITKEFWDAFRVIFDTFQHIEVELADEFFVPIGNYIARAPEHFLQIPNGVAVVLDKMNNVNLGEDVTGWEFVVEVLASVGKANSALLNGAIDLAIKNMDGARTSVLLHIFRVLWTAMYIDARVTLQKLDAKQPNWWKRWTTIQPKSTGFGRVGKKIVTLGMISLISLNLVVDVPKTVVTQTDGFVAVFKQLIPLLTALQEFASIGYIAPISQMAVTAAESVALRAEASANRKVVDDDDMFDGGEYNDEDEEDVMTFGDDEEGAAPPNFVQGVLNQMNAEWEDGGDDGEEDGFEDGEDESKSVLLAVDELTLLFNARKSDPSKFETILGALDEEDRLEFEEHLKRVKIGPKSLLDQAIEFVGRHYERYETDPNMKRLNRDVVERINKWLVTPQPLPEK